MDREIERKRERERERERERVQRPRPPSCAASEQKGGNLRVFNGFGLKVKARIWP